MAFMNAYFGSRPWHFAKTSFGGGAVSSAILFGLAHALWFDPAYSLHTAPFAGVRTAFDGFLFALLVERTKSLWPSVILHNALNWIGNH